LTGGRLKRVKPYLVNEESFCFTYGDGLSNVDIASSIEFHKSHGKLATVTAVQPPGRYGALILEGSSVQGFQEKPPGDGAWITGGFFVLSPKVIDLNDGDQTSWEGQPLETIARNGQLESFEHRGFWQPMDTLRDKNLLEDLWSSGNAPWKIWK
jgi:glucose-1-phosphate cytidylyltransferase